MTEATLARQAAPSLARAWWMVAALFAIYVFSWLDRLAISMLVGSVRHHCAKVWMAGGMVAEKNNV